MKEINIEIGTEKLGFSFGLAFLGELLDETNLSIDEVVTKLNKNPFKMIPELMYYSHKNYQERRSEELKYDRFTFVDLLDDNGGVASKQALSFLNAFTKSMTQNVPDEKVNSKKVLVKKK